MRYVRRPFQREPDFGAASVNYALKDLLATAEDPRQGGWQSGTGRRLKAMIRHPDEGDGSAAGTSLAVDRERSKASCQAEVCARCAVCCG